MTLTDADLSQLQEWTEFEARLRAKPLLRVVPYLFPYLWWLAWGAGLWLVLFGLAPILRYVGRIVQKRFVGGTVEKLGRGLCWFCETTSADTFRPAEVKMFHVEYGVNVEFVKVPRCKGCRQIHDRMDALPIFAGLGLAVVAVIPGALIWGWYGLLIALGAFVAAYVAGLLLGGLFLHLRHQGNIKSLSAAEDYPAVLAKMQEGWVVIEVK